MGSQRSKIVLQLLPLLKNTSVDIKVAQYLLLLCQIHIRGAEFWKLLRLDISGQTFQSYPFLFFIKVMFTFNIITVS